MNKEHWHAILIIFGFMLLRMTVVPTFGLGVDEAHYLLYAKYLDLSYVDHPPLVGWVHALFFYLLGTSEFLARLPAILIFAATSWFIYILTRMLSQSRDVALLVLLAINGCFMLNALAIMLLPDSILMLLALLLLIVMRNLIHQGRVRDFIFLGILLGLAGLTKYTAILFVPAILLHLIWEKRFDILFAPAMILTGLIALALIAPVLVWNWQHDFISFRYQGGHVFARQNPDFLLLIKSLAAQFGAYSPFLFVIAFYGFIRGWRLKNDTVRMILLMAGIVLIFFLYSSLYEATLPHWPCVFYLLTLPIGVWMLWKIPKRLSRGFVIFSIAFSLLLTLFAYVELSGKFITFPDYRSPFRDIYGYDQIAAKAQTILDIDQQNARPRAIAVSNWTVGSRVEYYGIRYHQIVFVIDDRRDQFDVWKPSPPLGYDLLFLNSHFNNVDVQQTMLCDQVCPAGKLPLILNGSIVDDVEFIWCRNYQGRRQ